METKPENPKDPGFDAEQTGQPLKEVVDFLTYFSGRRKMAAPRRW
jgi:hypothetical protein